MARSYANIITAIWNNDAFRRLNAADQRTYLMLVTQADISAAGVLALRVRRWSTYATDTTIDDITESLARLTDARFLVIATDDEELLVRSFVRWDNGYTNPKRRAAIYAAARDVRSPTVRRAIAAELRRLGLPAGDLDDQPHGSHPDSLSAPRDDQPIDADLNMQVDSLSDSQPIDAWVVDPLGPNGSAHNPQPPSPTPAASRPEEGAENDHDQPARDHPGSAPPTTSPIDDQPGHPGNDAVNDLIAQIRAIRPEWSTRSIRRAVISADVLERPWPVVQHAALALAHDPTTQAPGRLPHDGPWWAQPQPQTHLSGLAGAPRCPRHRGQPAHNCASCRAERIGIT